ncbi:MAG: hypothetical protein Q4C58_02785 [Eubacteriales bacterium]|nr:hypothetical protein [Eubacteriales bacterium]
MSDGFIPQKKALRRSSPKRLCFMLRIIHAIFSVVNTFFEKNLSRHLFPKINILYHIFQHQFFAFPFFAQNTAGFGNIGIDVAKTGGFIAVIGRKIIFKNTQGGSFGAIYFKNKLQSQLKHLFSIAFSALVRSYNNKSETQFF